MSQGFDNGKDDSQDKKKAIRKIVKEYKKIKKYQKSPLYEVTVSYTHLRAHETS